MLHFQVSINCDCNECGGDTVNSRKREKCHHLARRVSPHGSPQIGGRGAVRHGHQAQEDATGAEVEDKLVRRREQRLREDQGCDDENVSKSHRGGQQGHDHGGGDDEPVIVMIYLVILSFRHRGATGQSEVHNGPMIILLIESYGSAAVHKSLKFWFRNKM